MSQKCDAKWFQIMQKWWHL